MLFLRSTRGSSLPIRFPEPAPTSCSIFSPAPRSPAERSHSLFLGTNPCLKRRSRSRPPAPWSFNDMDKKRHLSFGFSFGFELIEVIVGAAVTPLSLAAIISMLRVPPRESLAAPAELKAAALAEEGL